jgi:hypothetical protein
MTERGHTQHKAESGRTYNMTERPQGREWPSTAYRTTQEKEDEPQEGLKEDEWHLSEDS